MNWAHHIVTYLDRPADAQTIAGDDLLQRGLAIEIHDQPGAVIFTYGKTQRP